MTLNSRYSERDKRGQAPADLSSLTARRHLQHFLHFIPPINHHHEPHTTLCTLFNFPLPYTNTPANIHQTSRVSFILIHLSLSKAALPHRQFLPVLLTQSIAPPYCQFRCSYTPNVAHFHDYFQNGCIFLSHHHQSNASSASRNPPEDPSRISTSSSKVSQLYTISHSLCSKPYRSISKRRGI